MAQQYQEDVLFQYINTSLNIEFVWQCPDYYSAIIKTLIVCDTLNQQGNTYNLYVRKSGGRNFTVNNVIACNAALAAGGRVVLNDLWIKYPCSIGIQHTAVEGMVITAFGSLFKTG